MNQILSTRDQRYLTILKALYNTPSQTLVQLAKISDSSKRSVQIDIKYLNTFIEPLFIATNSKDGCFLICPNDISVDYIYSLILIHSFEFSILEDVFFQKHHSLDSFAETLYTSSSTLKRTIKKMNKRLATLDFQISTAPIQLKGNEPNICNTMINFLSEKYRFDELPFSKLQMQIFDQLFLYLNKTLTQTTNFSDRQQFKLYFFVVITRIQNDHITTTETLVPDSYNLKFLDNYLLKKIFKSVFKVPLTEQTVLKLTHFIIKSNFAVNYPHLLSIVEESPTERESLQKLENFLISISIEFDLPLLNKETLLLELFNIKQLTIGKSYLLHDTRTEFVNSLIKESSHISDIVYSAIKKATELTSELSNLDPSQLVYIFITHWEGFSDFLHSLKLTCEAGVFFNSDTEHAQFIADYLEQKFNGEIHFKVLDAVTLKEAAVEATDYSFIITNISKLPLKSVPCISVGMFPSANDINKITHVYQSLNDF